MMTEQFSHKQTLAERDALHPTEPTTDEVIILGEDAYPSRTELIPVSQEQLLERNPNSGFYAAVQELDGWLLFKVKNELVGQIFDPHSTDRQSVNIAAVATTLQAEIAAEKAKHSESAAKLENETIPSAGMRTEPEMNSKNPYIYWQKDVENLWERVEVHMNMVEYIDAFEGTGEDWLYDLSEQYIARAREGARDEAIQILLQQREELEEKKRHDAERIEQLEAKLGVLTAEKEQAQAELQERDMQLLDDELVTHLTEEAEKLAA